MERIGQGYRKAASLPTRITLREVSLQDGLQGFARPLPTAFKCDWILVTYAAGLRHIAVGAYLPPGRLLEKSDTPEVVAFATTLPDLQVSAVVHDAESARRAFDHGVGLVTVPVVVTASHAAAACRARDAAGTGALVEARIGAAFGSPNGKSDEARTRMLVQAALDAGCDVIGLEGTSVRAAPAQVLRMFRDVRSLAGTSLLSAHAHDNGDLGFATVRAALQAGATMLDVTLAGGNPVWPDAAGKAPIGSVMTMLDAEGVDTGVDLRALDELREFAVRHAGASAHHTDDCASDRATLSTHQRELKPRWWRPSYL